MIQLLIILYHPTKTRTFEVDDAFGIFIGFQIEVSDDERAMPTSDFRKMVRTRVDQVVSKHFAYIQKRIVDLKLQGHNFYIYILPFTDIDAKRKNIMEAITK